MPPGTRAWKPALLRTSVIFPKGDGEVVEKRWEIEGRK